MYWRVYCGWWTIVKNLDCCQQLLQCPEWRRSRQAEWNFESYIEGWYFEKELDQVVFDDSCSMLIINQQYPYRAAWPVVSTSA